jgi:hypothetical protein
MHIPTVVVPTLVRQLGSTGISERSDLARVFRIWLSHRNIRIFRGVDWILAWKRDRLRWSASLVFTSTADVRLHATQMRGLEERKPSSSKRKHMSAAVN